MWSVGEALGSIQVLMYHHLATCQRCSPAHPLDLQAQVLKAHGVVAIHGAFELEREGPLQITTSAGHKSVAALCRRDLKAAAAGRRSGYTRSMPTAQGILAILFDDLVGAKIIFPGWPTKPVPRRTFK